MLEHFLVDMDRKASPSDSKAVYLVNESDGPIDLHYAYLLALQGRVAAHTQPRAVLGHKSAGLREAEWRS